MDNPYSTISSIRASKTMMACIYRWSGSPRTPARDAQYAAVESALARRLAVQLVDERFLSSYEGMFRTPYALLVILELETVAERSFRNLKDYLSSGGALLVSSEDLFMAEAEKTYQPLFENLKQHDDDYFRHTAAFLGLKPYRAESAPSAALFDTEIMRGLPLQAELALPPHGVFCTTSSDLLHPEPPYGHVFPERYEVCRNYPVVRGADPLGRVLSTAVVFCQNWESGSRLVAIASNGRNGMLDPANPLLGSFISSAVDFCLNSAFIASVEPGYACYRDGEQASVEYVLKNFHEAPFRGTLSLEVQAGGESVRVVDVQVEIPAAGTLRGQKSLDLKDFSADTYGVTARLLVEGAVVSRASNGFVVWKDDVVVGGPRVAASNGFFTLDGAGALVTGTNYYESTIGEMMWLRPNVASLARDLSAMKASGINFIRIHYHHAKWFSDFMRGMHGAIPSVFGPPAGPLPDERALRIFDAHVYLCQKLGIVYGGDLFTLLPEELGDFRGWYGVHDYLGFPAKVAFQKRFLEALIPRYRDVPGIAWDLFNEPKGVEDDLFLSWAVSIRDIIRSLGDSHLITVGTENPVRYEEAVDFFSEHRNFRMAGNLRIGGTRPEMIQEVWLDRPCTFEGARAQQEDMKTALLAAFASGQGGFSPWQWTNQARLWGDYRAFSGEIWDDRLGCCVRDDGTMKPAGAFYRDFAHLVRGIRISGFEKGKYRTSAGTLEFRKPRVALPKRGELLIAHSGGGRLLQGLVHGKLSVRGQTVLEGEEDSDIWFLAPGVDGVQRGAELYFKPSRGGRLIAYRTGSSSPHLSLRSSPWAERDLCPLPVEARGERISLTLEDWHTDYWVRLTFQPRTWSGSAAPPDLSTIQSLSCTHTDTASHPHRGGAL